MNCLFRFAAKLPKFREICSLLHFWPLSRTSHTREQRHDVLERFIDHRAYRTQGVTLRNKVIEAAHSEQALGVGVSAAHVWIVFVVIGLLSGSGLPVLRIRGGISAAC